MHPIRSQILKKKLYLIIGYLLFRPKKKRKSIVFKEYGD